MDKEAVKLHLVFMQLQYVLSYPYSSVCDHLSTAFLEKVNWLLIFQSVRSEVQLQSLPMAWLPHHDQVV